MSRYKKQQQPETTSKKASATQRAPVKSDTAPHTRINSGQLIEQQRAQYALKAVNQAIHHSEDEHAYKHTELKAYIRRFPGMVQMNGFGQAVAFYYSKRATSKAYGAVYTIVEEWLCGPDQVYSSYLHDGPHPLLTAITSEDQNSYRAAQAETQALMLWIKKFADALILNPDQANTD
jgi:CRISPR-associated protein Cmr5